MTKPPSREARFWALGDGKSRAARTAESLLTWPILDVVGIGLCLMQLAASLRRLR